MLGSGSSGINWNAIELVQYLYTKYNLFSEHINNLKILYRPYGFLNYDKHFDNISEKRQSNNDLLLIGTGNVGKYHIKFKKFPLVLYTP